MKKAEKIFVFLLFAVVFLFVLTMNTQTASAALENCTVAGGGVRMDTHVLLNAPDTNYGSSTDLYVGYKSTWTTVRYFIKFNLSDIPSGSTIDNATFYILNHLVEGTAGLIGAYDSDNVGWSDNVVTWNKQPAYTHREDVCALTSNVWGEWRVDNIVKQHFDNGSDNMTIVLKEVTEAANMLGYLNAMGYGTAQPYLEIYYTTPPANVAPNKPTDLLPSTRQTSTSVTISCVITDNDDDMMNVAFYDNSDNSIIGWDNDVENGATASVVWEELTRGNTYTFFAGAQDNQGAWGENSDTQSFMVNSLPNKPTDLLPSVRQITTNVNISCVATDNDNDRINVFFYDAVTTVFIDNVWVDNGETAQVTWDGLTRGLMYTFFVGALDNYGEGENWDQYEDTQTFIINSLPIAENQETENRVNPACIATLAPQLSWDYFDAESDAQENFWVQVGTSENLNDMWDDNYQSSDNFIIYAGSGLSENTTYHWRIKVFDNYEWSDWLYGGTFKIGTWGLIETWTGTVEAPAEWKLVEEWTGTVEANTPPIAENQRVSGLINPTYLVTATPPLSWSYYDNDGDVQENFWVRVGTVENGYDMWDYNTTSADNSVVYAGAALSENTMYYWKVNVYDNHDWSGWSSGGTFGTPTFAAGAGPAGSTGATGPESIAAIAVAIIAIAVAAKAIRRRRPMP